jgi:hypothetical protein
MINNKNKDLIENEQVLENIYENKIYFDKRANS